MGTLLQAQEVVMGTLLHPQEVVAANAGSIAVECAILKQNCPAPLRGSWLVACAFGP